MIESMTFTNADGTTYYQLNTDNTPLTVFDPTIQRRTETGRTRSQRHGVNPTLVLKGGMEVHLEGAIFDDSSALYVARRRAFVAAIEGDPSIDPDPTIRYDGILQVELTGETEPWQTQCIVSEFTSPVRGLYPSLTEWALTLFSWTPWFIGTISGDRYYWT